MNVIIHGFNALGIYLGSLLTLKGDKVAFIDAGLGETKINTVRIITPGKWFKIENIRYGAQPESDLVIVCPEQEEITESYLRGILDQLKSNIHQDTEVVVCNTYYQATDEAWKRLRNNLCFALPLLPLQMMQPDQIELFTDKPVLILEKNRLVKKYLSPLGKQGLQCKFVDSLAAYNHTYRLFTLTYLPVALSNTTWEHFLSYPEGQRIAQHVLNEGLKIYAQQEKKLGALSQCDPLSVLSLLQKKPAQFQAARTLPGRDYNPVLQAFIQKQKPRTLINQELLHSAAQLGIALLWNEKLVSLMEQVPASGLYKSPVELLKAIE